jgi:hypothetical protein
MFRQRSVESIWVLAMIPAVAACSYVLIDVWKLKSTIANQSLAMAIQTVKRAAKKVPIWLTVVAWSMLGASGALFIAGS